MDYLKFVTEIKDLTFSLILLFLIGYFGKLFFDKYPIWRAEDQKAKDARAETYRKSMEGLAIQVGDAVKASQESTKSIHESLGKSADKQQARHGELLALLGSILNNEPSRRASG